MTPARLVALAQLCAGRLQAHRPELALSLLGYPRVSPRGSAWPPVVVGLLGARQMLQGAAELTARRSFLLTGAAVDVVHAGTALLYAHRSRLGRTAGRRSAAVALAFAAAQALAAARAPAPSNRHQEPRPSHPKRAPVARVNGPNALAWPEPTDPEQHIRVEYPGGRLVQLRGGAMEGATVSLEPGQRSYSITDSERGRLHYLPTGRHNDGELPVLRLQEAEGGST